MNWMKTKVLQTIFPSTDLGGYAQQINLKWDCFKTYMLDFIREADFNITDIKTRKESIKETSTLKGSKTYIEHTVENERGVESYMMEVNREDESEGTLRTLDIVPIIYTAIKQDTFFAIDEIETSLHSKLLEKILFEYLKTPSRSQLLVTTHNDGLLDLVDDLIRKDSVWFTEKKKSGVTDLYKLTDFRGVNRLSSIREAYRNKRFGATMN
jgi:AAA15 family ATPase/GTPase